MNSTRNLHSESVVHQQKQQRKQPTNAAAAAVTNSDNGPVADTARYDPVLLTGCATAPFPVPPVPPGFAAALLIPLPLLLSRDCDPAAILSPLPLPPPSAEADATPELIAVQRLDAGESFIGRRRTDCVASVCLPVVRAG